MKRLLSFLIFLSLFAPSAFATPPMLGSLTMDDVEVFSQDNKFGLKDKAGNVVVDADYKKLIRLGKSSWIIQKGSKFGIMDSNGNYLVEPKYRHVDRFFGSYAKLGNDKDYGLYNEKGEIIIVPEYSRIDPLFGQTFLTCKNYKYGIVDSEGNEILENPKEKITSEQVKAPVKQQVNQTEARKQSVNTNITEKQAAVRRQIMENMKKNAVQNQEKSTQKRAPQNGENA